MSYKKMTLSGFVGIPVKLLAQFLALAGIPLVALGVLGWHLLDQDRAIETQAFDAAGGNDCCKS